MSSDLHSDLSRYNYTPLDPIKRQIRPIRLAAEREDGDVHCELDTFDFEDAPTYTALSYTWGPATPHFNVHVAGYIIQIRENLYHFLKRYQFREVQERYLWIDQLSIDQSNVDERSAQVQFMSKIYKKSKTVIMWLGDGLGPESERERYDAAVRFSNKEYTPIYDDRDRGAVLTILGHPCFSRLWIVQEVLLASDIKVLLRDLCIPWEDMRRAIWTERLGISALETQGAEDLILWTGLKVSRPETRKGLLIFGFFSDSACLDPRDKVYALISLSEWTSDRLIVDYRKSVCQVFSDLVMCAFSSALLKDTDDHRFEHSASVLKDQFRCMGGPAHLIKSLDKFMDAIWHESRIVAFVGLPSPLTAMGVEPASDNVHGERWWYEFQGRRYHVADDPKTWSMEHQRPLLVDWKEYLPMEVDGSISCTAAETKLRRLDAVRHEP